MRKRFTKKCVSIILALTLCGISVGANAANTQKEKVASAEEKISASLYKKLAETERTKTNASAEIPVWIWYKDIDQKQVDLEVKNKTGLTEESIPIEYEMPNAGLINDLKNNTGSSQTDMQQYLKRTEKQREKEEKRTNTFIKTRRDLSREKYTAESEKVLDAVNIKKNQILFNSRYAPAVVVKMTKAQIEQAAKNHKIQEISYYEEGISIEESDESALISSNIVQVSQKTGLSGNQVKVGLIENALPGTSDKLNPENIICLVSGSVGSHATNMATIIGGTNGVAPNAKIYCTTNNYVNIEQLLTCGVKVINMSLGYTRNSTYTEQEKWIDHIVSQHSVAFVKSAGNEGPGTVTSPGLAYNIITAGAYDDRNTATQSDDAYAFYNRYDNANACEKPDIIAPGNRTNSGGTSNAAAHTTGIIALMLELKPSLAYQPQVIKAILLASCQRKATNPVGVAAETMSQGLTDRQGAGAVDAWNSICIISQEQYGYGEFSGTEEKRSFIQPKYGASNMNVSIAWMRENMNYTNHTAAPITLGTQHDLDLEVYRNGNLSRSSELANSSTEMIYMPLSSTSNNYQIRTYKVDRANTEKVRYGYAWCTDKMTYKENLSIDRPEGMYYIRNKTSGMYLTVNETTGQVTQSAFSGSRNQQWTVSRAVNNQQKVMTNSSVVSGRLTRGGNINHVVVNQSGNPLLYFGGNGFDNTYCMQQNNPQTSARESVYLSNPLTANSTAIWSPLGFPDCFQWYFERIGYQQGDVNFDGAVSTQDVLLVQQYMASAIVFSDAQRYLADIDNNGAVSLADVTKIQNMIAAAG